MLDKFAKMPLKAKPLPQTNGEYWSPPEGIKVIAFNHRWNETTGARQLHKMIEGLPEEYQVLVTDEKVKNPLSGYSPVDEGGKLEELEERNNKSIFQSLAY